MTVSAIVFSAGTLFGLSLQLRDAQGVSVALVPPVVTELGGQFGAFASQVGAQGAAWASAAAAGIGAILSQQAPAEAALSAASGIALPPAPEMASVEFSQRLDSLLPIDALLASAPRRPAPPAAVAEEQAEGVTRVGAPLNDEGWLGLETTQQTAVDLEGPVLVLARAETSQVVSEATRGVVAPPPVKPQGLVTQSAPASVSSPAALARQGAAASAFGAYSIQLGAFRDLANAELLAQRAATLGLGVVEIRRLEGAGQGLHAVQLRGFADVSSARAVQAELDMHGLERGMVVRDEAGVALLTRR